MFTGVNSSLSSMILMMMADADVGLAGMTYLHRVRTASFTCNMIQDQSLY